MSGAGALSIALDLGSTRVKGAVLLAEGRLGAVLGRDAPPILGEGLVRESDPRAWAALVHELVGELRRDGHGGLPLGLSSQRSSFLLWERASGAPATPLISWQDRRAADWCARNAHLAPRVAELTGLVLSPHYAGPKLAALQETQPALRARMASGELVFGTLDAWILRQLSGGAVHRTDATMAARTALADPRASSWSAELCAAFGVAQRALPEIGPSHGDALGPAAAHLSDQAAGMLALLGADGGGALVNLGTGGFVLLATGASFRRCAGYLSGPVLAGAGGTRFALEGTINGGGAAADRLAPGPTAILERDPAPAAFCLPDENGVGAPYWLPASGMRWSAGAAALAPAERRRVFLEGLAFRVAGILADLSGAGAMQALRLAGGLARDPFVPRALAAVLGRRIEVLGEVEASLAGAARLAAGREPRGADSFVEIEPEPALAWLEAKARAWRDWVREQLAGEISA